MRRTGLLALLMTVPFLLPTSAHATAGAATTASASTAFHDMKLAVVKRRLGPNACYMGVPDMEGVDVCFAPARVSVAERRLSEPPIHPGSLVWRLTGLRLRHVMLRISGQPFAIEYLYGHKPLSKGQLPVFIDGEGPPYYVLIDENTTLPIPPARSMSHPEGQPGQWHFFVILPCRHLTLSVYSNVSPQVTLQVMHGLQAAARCAP